MPTRIEPSNDSEMVPQAKHVPRGQRGLGHGFPRGFVGTDFILT